MARSAVAEQLAGLIAPVDAAMLRTAAREICERLLIDVRGLCVAARSSDYVRAALAAWPEPGSATVIGHDRTLSAAGAAFVNGTAAHGGDFDDTFEGGPVHACAVIVPAVLAVAEQERLDGAAVLRGIAVGVETVCRLSTVVPKAVHKAGFHPTDGAPAGALQALLAEANAALRRVGRIGFRREDRGDAGVVAALAAGAAAVVATLRELDRLLPDLPESDAGGAMSDDRPRFETAFRRIYGSSPAGFD